MRRAFIAIADALAHTKITTTTTTTTCAKTTTATMPRACPRRRRRAVPLALAYLPSSGSNSSGRHGGSGAGGTAATAAPRQRAARPLIQGGVDTAVAAMAAARRTCGASRAGRRELVRRAWHVPHDSGFLSPRDDAIFHLWRGATFQLFNCLKKLAASFLLTKITSLISLTARWSRRRVRPSQWVGGS